MQPPPCVIAGTTLNACARSVYALEINQTYDLGGAWRGWKLRGGELVSPDRDRIGPDHLAHLMHMQKRFPGDATEHHLSVTLPSRT